MTKRIEKEKWTLYRHTKDFNLICNVGLFLREFNSSISEKSKKELLIKLKEVGLYNERNSELPLDAINHKINQLANNMFGYKSDGKLLFSPLGNLFFKYIDDIEKRSKIFLTMLWSVQYPHPHAGTGSDFKLFPYRLIFKLLLDPRIENKLYAYEVAMKVVFIKETTIATYEQLVGDLLELRQKSDEDIIHMLKEDEHVYVNAAYEWDYYVSRFFENAGIVDIENGETICSLRQGLSSIRKVTRNVVTINSNVFSLVKTLSEKYPADASVLSLDDPEQLQINVIKEIYSFYPEELLLEINETNEGIEDVLSLPKLIEKYADNNEGKEAYLFEDILTEGFNMFINVEARKIGGAGNADIECLYIPESKKFSVDAKSTKNKLSGLNAGRLTAHREKIGGAYTIVITPRYVPAVRHDISGRKIVIILARTFSEYLYNHIINDVRDIDFADIDKIIEENLGKDISPLISGMTINKFAKKIVSQY